MFRFFSREKKPVEKTLSNIDKAILQLSAIQPAVFQYSQSSDLSMLKVSVICTSIEAYYKKLEYYLEALTEPKILKSFDFQNLDIKVVPLAQFFRTEKNEYLADDAEMAQRFFALVIALLTRYQEVENVDDQADSSHILIHNRMVLQATIHNVLHLISEFQAVERLVKM